MDNGTSGDVGSGGDAALAARDFRDLLQHRRDIDDLVAEAVAVRQRASLEGAEIIRNAEAVAHEIVADAHREAARVTAESTRLAAEAKRALEAAAARADRADAAHGERVSATLGRLESMASEVHMVLDNAIAEVTASLAGEIGSESDETPWNDRISAPQARAAAEARLDRWRERFRQAR